MEALCKYDWPGNVRQLQNEIQRLVSLSMNNKVIGPEALSSEIRTGTSSQPAPAAAIIGDQIQITMPISTPYKEALDIMRKLLITHALEQTSSNLTQTAERLNIDRVGLQKAIKRLGIDVEKYRKEPSP